MAVGAGAHLHGFIEWDESAILTCSDDAYSTNWLGRWWMSGAVDGVHVEGSTNYHKSHAVLRGHILRARKRCDERLVGSARFRSPFLGRGRQLK